MRGKLWRLIFAGFLMFNVAVMLAMRDVSMASEQPTASVDPNAVSAAPGEFVTLNVTVADLTAENSQPLGLCGWQVNITFNPAILNVSAVAEGPFLKQAGSTWWLPPVLDNENGFVAMGDSIFPLDESTQGVYGSGVLANVTFQVIDEGQMELNFDSDTTKLRSYDSGTGTPVPISHSTVGGAFKYPILRDVAVSGVSFSPTSVPAGGTVSIDVAVKNEGDFLAESFDVGVSYGSTPIETKSITALAHGASETVNFNWDTSGIAEGSYTITAVVATVPDETETTDNTFQSVDVVTITAPQPTLPMELVIGGIIVIAVVGVVAFLLMKRRSAKA